MKKMSKFLIFLLLVALAVGCYLTLLHQNQKVIDEAVETMEKNDEFSPEEVDRLWNIKEEFMMESKPDSKFMKLYEKKIRPLPGRKG